MDAFEKACLFLSLLMITAVVLGSWFAAWELMTQGYWERAFMPAAVGVGLVVGIWKAKDAA